MSRISEIAKIGLARGASGYDALEALAARTLFVRLLPRVVRDRLALIGTFRRLVKLGALAAVCILVVGVFLLSPKLLTISGILFDLAGFGRVFIDEEWEDVLEAFKDEKAYPYGPPSYITRELFLDDDPDALGDVEGEGEHIARHLYWRRGMALIIIGFALQLVGAVSG